MLKVDVEMKGGRETDLEGLRVMCIPWPYCVHKFWNIDLHASCTVVLKKVPTLERAPIPYFGPISVQDQSLHDEHSPWSKLCVANGAHLWSQG